MRTFAVTIALLGVLNGTAWAYDRFVNPGGTCGAGTVGSKPQHATIQQAVDAAAPGDEIGVCPGTYAEGATVPAGTPGLSFTGLGIVVVDGQGIPPFPAFDVFADDVTIQRFEIQGFESGIAVAANRATIQNNDLHDNPIGVDVSGDGHRIRNNAIAVNVTVLAPIFATVVNGIEISGNRLTGGIAGIAAFDVDQTSPGTVIHHNVVTGGLAGIAVATAGAATIRSNTIRENEEAGIVATDAVGLAILQNVVQRNGGVGINVSDSTDCTVGFNTVSFNGLVSGGQGIELAGIEACTITRNNVSRNNAPDCLWDGAGANTFTANSCASEAPPGAWD